MGITSALVGLAVITLLGAPRELITLLVAMVVGLIIFLGNTLFWKASIHMAYVVDAIVILVLVFGPPFVVLAPLVMLVSWPRVELGDHTPSQETAGSVIGAAWQHQYSRYCNSSLSSRQTGL